jgi:hypothetical protein
MGAYPEQECRLAGGRRMPWAPENGAFKGLFGYFHCPPGPEVDLTPPTAPHTTRNRQVWKEAGLPEFEIPKRAKRRIERS